VHLVDLFHPVVGLMLLAAFLGIGWARAASRVGRDNARRGRVARRAEDEAEGLLHDLGYVIQERQAVRAWPMLVDGEAVRASVRADLLVTRNGETFVAEVKSGGAAKPTLPATRRQLLEYLLAFEVHGVLLVDMERGSVHPVEFPAVAIDVVRY
jgi:hypothetical protein